jgi:hypothetical protein
METRHSWGGETPARHSSDLQVCRFTLFTWTTNVRVSYSFSLGSSASRRPTPTRLMTRTVR